MLVPEKDLRYIQRFLDENGIANELISSNVTQQLRRERRALLGPVQGDITLEHIQKKYLSFDDQMALLVQLAKQFPQLVEVWQIATSYEGRSIYAIKIGYPSTVKKPILWIDAGIHAREWIAHSTALNIIWQFIHDSSYKRLLHEIDIIVVPNTNPDGYEYSREVNRMWRKTRSRSSASRFSEQCSGVDANRNYPFHFGEEGVSHWPCQEIYCGRMALSEPEVMGLAAAILDKKDQIRGYIALHSFGQDILYPWGHKVHVSPPDVDDLVS
ncbi:zinc carboxypeptidase, partial [Oesophagostomum dentatum]